ncbi:hypothetical protein CYD26_05420 [Pseudomonas sp. FFUP_PS_473]|nr:hypothetical protein CYD26_05420 [Pseudomonas sp. FFUP_PS_473]
MRCVAGFVWSSVSVWQTHLPNSSLKDDGVRVFFSGRDRPYRQDFHAQHSLSPSCSAFLNVTARLKA